MRRTATRAGRGNPPRRPPAGALGLAAHPGRRRQGGRPYSPQRSGASAAWRPAVEKLIAESPAVGEAEWSGSESTQKALRWKHDGQLYSASGIARRILMMTNVEPGSLPGPSFWQLPSGRSLYEESKLIDAELDAEEVENPRDRDS